VAATVEHPERAPWVTGYLNELVGFPDLPHDDRCDATSMALHILRTGVEAARAVSRPTPAKDLHDNGL
jgi:phage terminase large subunit-like protein